MMMACNQRLLAIFAVLYILECGAVSGQYLGKFLGKLSELHHGVSGEVYAVDGRTIHIKDFTYDGQGPAAYFYASTSKAANSAGFRLRDETGSNEVIRRYRKEGVTLTLPEGKTLNNIKIFYVWCEEFEVNFGDVKIPRGFDYPRPQKIAALKGVHAVSSDNIVIVDAQTLLIPNLSYDGEAPDAKFWVGRGPKPSPQGIRVPDENGKEVPLRRYDRKTIVLTLPGDLTVFDIGHFGIWCEAFTVDFGHVQIPQGLNIPPSLKMLGVSPQSKLNCEVLYDDLAFEVRWAVAGESIVLQLVAKLDDREYMSFGISGDESNSIMVGGDVVVAWVDKETLKGYAEDYYLDDKSQCSGQRGSCPDTRLSSSEKTNNIRLLNAAMVNGYSIVTYQRPLRAADEFDKPIYTNRSQAVIWAIGPLNQRNEVSFHSQYLKNNKKLDFGRPAKWNCPMPENDQPPMRAVPTAEGTKTVEEISTAAPQVPQRSRNTERRRGNGNRGSTTTTAKPEVVEDSERSASRNRQQSRGNTRRGSGNSRNAVPTPAPVSKRNAWTIPPIQCYEPEDGVFYAQMGPTGGKRGYPAITGHVGWGISWYVNGLLIPEINVVRGKTYTFVVEGGLDPEVPAKYHPFYITDDPVGGYEYKTPEEKKNIKIFAGVRKNKDGSLVPTGTGRLCHWTQQGENEADDFDSFGAYQRTLELKCDQGEPGVIQWTPDRNTPDTVYYQCFTHRYLGWKINVLDSCDESPAGSEIKPVVVPFNSNNNNEESAEDLEGSQSVRVESLVKDNNNIITNSGKFEKDSTIEKSQYISDGDDEHGQLSPLPNPSTTTSTISTTSSSTTSTYPGLNQNEFLLPKEPLLVYHYNDKHYHHHGGTSINHQPMHNHHQPMQSHHFKPSAQILLIPQTSISTNQSNIISLGGTISSNSNYSQSTFSTSATSTSTTSTTTVPSTTIFNKDKPIVTKNNKPLVLLPKPQMVPLYHHYQPKMPRPGQGQFMFVPPPPPPQMRPLSPLISLPSYAVPNIVLRPKYQMKKPLRPIKPAPIKIQSYPPMNPIFTNTKNRYRNVNNNNSLKQVPKVVPKSPVVTKVEISQQQASTEREPLDLLVKATQSIPISSVTSTTPASTTRFFMPPAKNTGFNPDSIVVENGFKPIIGNLNRVYEEAPEIQQESEIGVIPVKGMPKYERRGKDLEDSIEEREETEESGTEYPISVQKRAMEEPLTAAAERVESVLSYLPPRGSLPPSNKPKQKSNIDIDFELEHPKITKIEKVPQFESRSFSVFNSKSKEKPEGILQSTKANEEDSFVDIASPPDVVVTHDGRKISGASLTARPSNDKSSSVLEMRASKATEFIKARPQFVPYRGELPPLGPEFLSGHAPQLLGKGVISRELDTPVLPPPTDNNYRQQISTKLVRVQN